MNLLFIIACLLIVIATSYLLHQYHLVQRQQTRKRSLPLPPLVNNEVKLRSQTIDIERNKNANSRQPSVTSGNWQKLVSEMRKNGEFENALNLCKKKFPLYSAYKQTTLILRSVLQTEGLAKKKTEEAMLHLYKTAATAELIHMKRSVEDTIPSSELKKLNMGLIGRISFNYDVLGYLEIPLLTQKDIKTIVSHWGEPKKHDSPRKAYQKYLN